MGGARAITTIGRMSNKSELIESKLPCPVCPSSDAFHKWSDGHGYCFSCKTYIPPEGKEDFLDTSFTYEYFPHRGISRRAFEFYDVKTKVDAEGKPIRVGFRYPNDSYKIRPFGKKDGMYTTGDIGKAGLYGRDKFSEGAHRYVTICEGEYDALSLWDVLDGPVVSVQSAATAVRDCTADRSFLNSYERIYLALDGDVAGKAAAAAIARLFDYRKVFLVKFTKRKDANEYLEAGEREELRKIWWNAKPYLPDNFISSFEDVREILTNEKEPRYLTPFNKLNKMTYGFSPSEVVLFIAQEKVGKTEVLHELEYHFLQTTDWKIGAIYLEETPERHFQAIGGRHLRKRAHLPDSGLSGMDVADAYEEAVKTDGRLIVNTRFGSDDPDAFLDMVRFLATAGECRLILFDHLTMVVSGHQGDDERKTLDYISTKLEMMAKELNILIICVSHVNDFGQTRGSRNLTKVFDTTISLKRDLQAEDPVERRTIRMAVEFNRFGGETGPAGRLLFDPTTGLLEELDDDELTFPQRTEVSGYQEKGNKSSGSWLHEYQPELLRSAGQRGSYGLPLQRQRPEAKTQDHLSAILGSSPPEGHERYVASASIVGPNPEELDAPHTDANMRADRVGTHEYERQEQAVRDSPQLDQSSTIP
jgi:twinkle protein